MSVLEAVSAVLEGVECEGWERESALALARQMDESPNAALHKELRSLMKDLGSSVPSDEVGDVADELAAKRAARRRAAGA